MKPVELKQVIVMRKDLNMRKGKMVAQGAHASMMAVLNHLDNPIVEQWLNDLFTKIVVSVDSEEELLEIYQTAAQYGLVASLVRDVGLTEFHGDRTFTCAAIGPDKSDIIDLHTGHLKLL